jgi:Tfp pilus assembly protein PilN
MATTLMPLDPATSPQRAARVLPIVAHLLPDEIIAARRGRKVRARVIVVLVVVAVLIGSWYAVAAIKATNAQNNLDDITAEAQALQRKQSKYAEVIKVQADTTAITGHLSTLLAEDLRWSTLLGTLRSTGTSSAIEITAVSGALSSSTAGAGATPTDRLPTTGMQAIVGTLTVTGQAPDKISVARYVDALTAVKGLANPYLTSASEVEKKVQFSLQIDITAGALGGRFAPKATASVTTTAGGK